MEEEKQREVDRVDKMLKLTPMTQHQREVGVVTPGGCTLASVEEMSIFGHSAHSRLTVFFD